MNQEANPKHFVIFGDALTISVPWWCHAAPESGILESREECVEYFRRCMGPLSKEMLNVLLEALITESSERELNEEAGLPSTSAFVPEFHYLPEQVNPMYN